MHLPGFRSNRSRPDAAPGRRHRNAGAALAAVECLEARTMMDASSAGHPPSPIDPIGSPAVDAATIAAQLTPAEVNTLLQRASAADPTNNAIIAVVDRGGRVLGVRVDNGVSPAITGNASNLVFAVDGALAEARTGAFFGNNQAPLTSRTIQNLAESTVTQREIQSNPSITDPNSPLRGPGIVAPIGIKGHFPPGVPFTPQVDLFQIELTNRDSILHSIANGVIRTSATEVTLPSRFNVPLQYIPQAIQATGTELTPPESYGFVSGLEPDAQARGIGTLPGGLPIQRTVMADGTPHTVVIGGIGVFYPGTTGYALEENSALNDALFDPKKPDLSVQAELVALLALNGSSTKSPVGSLNLRFPSYSNAPPPVAGLDLQPFQRIDLVGITLDVVGPHGNSGPNIIIKANKTLNVGSGDANNGVNLPISNDISNQIFGFTTTAQNTTTYPNYTTLFTTPATGQVDVNQSVNLATNTRGGRIVPDGWLVTPHDGTGLTAADVVQIVAQGISRAVNTRAAIRLPINRQVRMVYSVSDANGNLLGVYRQPDATIFSIDVATAKSRNVAYYASTQLQPVDKLPTIPTGTALTNRTFRYLAEPRFPEGIDGQPPGPFSILTDGGTNQLTALNIGAPLAASAFQSVGGFDAFNPGTNFHQQANPLNQSGIVFFPGSVPLYKDVNGTGQKVLVGGFGISGDGVDQDDDVTFSGSLGFRPPANVPRADQVFVRGIRLPYQKFNRQPKV